MRGPVKWFLIGLLAVAGGIGVGLFPRSEQYSNDGYGIFGVVDLECGSPFSADPRANFHDPEERSFYGGTYTNAPIFEGKTATEACESLLSGSRTGAIVAIVAGGIVALGALIALAGSSGGSSQPSPLGPTFAAPQPQFPSPSPPAAPAATTSPGSWSSPTVAPDPPGSATGWAQPSPGRASRPVDETIPRPVSDAWWEQGR